MDDLTFRLFPYWDYYSDLIFHICLTQNFNKIVIYLAKGFKLKANVSSYIVLYDTKDIYKGKHL